MKAPQIILAIESSCDETSAAIVQNDSSGVKILSNIIASSADLQAKYGGVVPEQAAREQLSSIIPVIQESLSQAFPLHPSPFPLIDAIAVTQGPGLIGSLLIGVETAKILATIWNKPLVPVNHLIGHFYANWIVQSSAVSHQTSDSLIANRSPRRPILKADSLLPSFPCIGLLVSGGHTDLVLFEDHGKYQYLGGTRDDAAGEAFDKTARLLGLPYPGGPIISKLAKKGNPKAFNLPRPMVDSKDLDFSFSGLKTAVYNLIHDLEQMRGVIRPLAEQDPELINDLCASIQEAIVDILVKKTLTAAQIHRVDQIIVAGGVAANRKLAEKLIATAQTEIPRARVFIPPPKLCTDNAAYIGAAAFYNFHPMDPLQVQANPNLSLSKNY